MSIIIVKYKSIAVKSICGYDDHRTQYFYILLLIIIILIGKNTPKPLLFIITY